MYGRKWGIDTQTEQRDMKNMFIDWDIDKCYIYNKCSELRKSTVIHAW